MKSIGKRVLVLLLVANLCAVSVGSSYMQGNKVQATSVTVAYGAAEVFMAILASLGITYITTDMIVNGLPTDGTGALKDVEDAAETFGREYDKQRFKVIEGGGGNLSPENGGDENGKVPNWDTLMSAAVTEQSGKLEVQSEIMEIFQEVATGFIRDSYNLGYGLAGSLLSGDISLDELPNEFTTGQYKYIYFMEWFHYSAGSKKQWYLTKEIYLSNDAYKYYEDGSTENLYLNFAHAMKIRQDWSTDSYGTLLENLNDIKDNDVSSGVRYIPFVPNYSGEYKIRVDNLPSYASKSDYDNNAEPLPQDDNVTPIWVHPDYEPNWNDKDKPLMFPNINNQPLEIPSYDDIQELVNIIHDEEQLENPNDEKIKQALQDFFEKVLPEEVPEETEQNPEPPESEKPGGDDTPKEDYVTSGLENLFPFCIPFDLIKAIKIFNTKAEAPCWELHLKVDRIRLDYTLKLDLAEFDGLAKIVRVFMTIGFIISLILVTRKLIKG